MSPFDQAHTSFVENFKQSPAGVVLTPGRINIIGEHTDYTGGLALPAAINRYTAIAFQHHAEPHFNFWIESLGQMLTLSSDQPSVLAPLQDDLLEMRFLKGAVELSKNKNRAKRGGNFSIVGDIPLGRGLSSSASLTLALLHALQDPEASVPSQLIVERAREIEHHYLGVKCGYLDQIACEFSVAKEMLQIDFQTLQFKHLSFPASFDQWVWVTIDTALQRGLSESKYSERVAECAAGLELIQSRQGPKANILHYRDLIPAHLQKLSAKHPQESIYRQRLQHYLEENQRVLDLSSALQKGQGQRVGEILIQSHHSLSKLYQVSLPLIDQLVAKSLAHPAVLGARLMGGGFGGCTLNLVRKDQASQFIEDILAWYQPQVASPAAAFVLEMVGGTQIQYF